MSDGGDERRTGARVAVNRPCTVRSDDDALTLEAVLLNVSASGALVACTAVPAPLYLYTAGTLAFEGSVLACDLIRLNRAQLGLRFRESAAVVSAAFPAYLNGDEPPGDGG